MDNPKQDYVICDQTAWLKENRAPQKEEFGVIKYETFDPPFMTTGKEIGGFTVGKEYPVYREIISDTTVTEPRAETPSTSFAGILETKEEDEDYEPPRSFVANHTVMYLVKNDYDEMVLKSSAYFKLMVWENSQYFYLRGNIKIGHDGESEEYAHADIYEKEKRDRGEVCDDFCKLISNWSRITKHCGEYCTPDLIEGLFNDLAQLREQTDVLQDKLKDILVRLTKI